VSGAAGSNECPAGSVRIETEAVCRAAATAVGKTAGSPFGVTSPIPPRGCYYSTITNTAYFNADAVGAGNYNAQLLCAVTRAYCAQNNCAAPAAWKTVALCAQQGAPHGRTEPQTKP
jgi:hypothetical protein